MRNDWLDIIEHLVTSATQNNNQTSHVMNVMIHFTYVNNSWYHIISWWNTVFMYMRMYKSELLKAYPRYINVCQKQNNCQSTSWVRFWSYNSNAYSSTDILCIMFRIKEAGARARAMTTWLDLRWPTGGNLVFANAVSCMFYQV